MRHMLCSLEVQKTSELSSERQLKATSAIVLFVNERTGTGNQTDLEDIKHQVVSEMESLVEVNSIFQKIYA